MLCCKHFVYSNEFKISISTFARKLRFEGDEAGGLGGMMLINIQLRFSEVRSFF